MRYLCNIGCSGVWAAQLIEYASPDGGGAGRRWAEGWRAKWLREAEIFVYPTKLSVSRNCFFYLP